MESEIKKKHTFGKLLGIIAIVLVGLYGYGTFLASNDLNNGLSLYSYSQRQMSLNPITQKAYVQYIEKNSDMSRRSQELQSSLNELKNL
jgi:hypothetical protein